MHIASICTASTGIVHTLVEEEMYRSHVPYHDRQSLVSGTRHGYYRIQECLASYLDSHIMTIWISVRGNYVAPSSSPISLEVSTIVAFMPAH